MQKTTFDTVEFLLLGGYILFSGFLNLLALLISSFYEKSLQKSSPKAGFIIAISLGIIFIILHFFEHEGALAIQIISISALLGSGLASIISILTLFFTMNKIQK